MHIDWNAIINAGIVFFVLLILKVLLDLKIAQFFVKYFWWLPVRNYFREKPVVISGKWEQIWDSANSEGFKFDTDRHSHPEIKQLGSYCYAEFLSKGVNYIVFGRVIGEYFVGDWFDEKDPRGYFGAFQLEIINSDELIGRWIGHSKKTHEVKSDFWRWRKIK